MIPCNAFSQTPEVPGTAAGVPGTAVEAPGAAAEVPAAEEGAEPAVAADSAAAIAEAERQFVLGAETPPGPGSGGAAPLFTILRMVLVLALVAGLIYLVVFFLRRLSRPQSEQNPHLKILASTHLGGGRYVHVVSVGTKAWLIGSGEGGISHIADINDQEAVDAMLLDASRAGAEKPGFNSLPAFQALLKRFSGGNEQPPEDRIASMRKRRERFKRF
jgi:flagellar protein FliO/FliZ